MTTELITKPTIESLGLAKGSVVPVETVETMMGVKYNTVDYAFALLKLKEEIVNHLLRKGPEHTVCCVKGAIHVLTDEEAVAYNAVASEQAIRKMGRAHIRGQAVVRRNLDASTRKVHERNLDLQGRILGEIERVQEEFLIEETTRKTPGLLE